MGLAFGIESTELGFGKEFVDAAPALTKIGSKPPKRAKRKRPAKDALPMPTVTQED
jgi:hypothetical protein